MKRMVLIVIGIFFLNGCGTSIDIDKQKSLCENNDEMVCYNIGHEYMIGYGVAQDFQQAIKYSKISCDKNVGVGCYNCAILYSIGEGVIQDFSQAKNYYEKGCELGYMDSCNNLGLLYSNGIGTDADIPKAKVYYEKACHAGISIACNNLKDIKENKSEHINGEAIAKHFRAQLIGNNEVNRWSGSKEFVTFLNKDTQNGSVVTMLNDWTSGLKSGANNNMLYAIILFIFSFLLFAPGPFGVIVMIVYVANALYYNNPAAILGGLYDMIIFLIRMFLVIFGVNI